MTKSSQKVSQLYTFFESTYAEMQLKHLSTVHECQASTRSHRVDD